MRDRVRTGWLEERAAPLSGRAITVLYELEDETRAAQTREQVNSLGDAAIDTRPLSPDDLGAGPQPVVLVISQERLVFGPGIGLETHLAAQPSWSNLPVILLVEDGVHGLDRVMQAEGFLEGANVTVLRWPCHPLELAASLRTAVRARRRQFELSELLEREKELRHEIDHRMKNQLSTVMAIYNISLRQSRSLEDFEETFGPRIKALDSVHNLLRQKPDTAIVLEDMCHMLFEPFRRSDSGQIVIEGGDLAIDRDRALVTALMLNELATNAAKHGALSVPEGTILLTVDAAESRKIKLFWAEEGGPAVTRPEVQSYGIQFIERSATMLGGTALFDYASTGLNVSIEFLRRSGSTG